SFSRDWSSDVCSSDLERKITQHRRFTWLKRRVSQEEVEAVRALSDPKAPLPIHGLTIEGEGHRFYPNRELAGPLLGFVSPDGEEIGRASCRERGGSAR